MKGELPNNEMQLTRGGMRRAHCRAIQLCLCKVAPVINEPLLSGNSTGSFGSRFAESLSAKTGLWR